MSAQFGITSTHFTPLFMSISPFLQRLFCITRVRLALKMRHVMRDEYAMSIFPALDDYLMTGAIHKGGCHGEAYPDAQDDEES